MTTEQTRVHGNRSNNTKEQTRVHGNCLNNDNRTNTGTWKLFKQWQQNKHGYMETVQTMTTEQTVHTCEVTILVVFISCEPA